VGGPLNQEEMETMRAFFGERASIISELTVIHRQLQREISEKKY